MDQKQKRILIIAGVAIVLVVLLWLGISKNPDEQAAAPIPAVAETQTQTPPVSGEETTVAPVLTNPTLPPEEAAELSVSSYKGRCAMNDGGLMYGDVVGIKKNDDPAKLESVQLRNAVTGEAMIFETKKGACVFEGPAKASKEEKPASPVKTEQSEKTQKK